MPKAFKSTMGVAFPIESINRKLALRSEKAGGLKVTENHNVELPDVQYMGGMTRTYNVVTGSGVKTPAKTQYLFIRKNGRLTALTNHERALRLNFKIVSKGIATLLDDLTQVTRIQAMWLAACGDISKKVNGKSAKGYATLRSWVFAVQYMGLANDEEYDVTTFPQSFDA